MSALDALLHRPRPTPWQLFLRQPCVYLARLLFSWRPAASIKSLTEAVSVVYISDTHNSQPNLPDGDILIHAGDLTQSGTLKELQAALAWLQSQPHPVKIVVAGNHDILLDPDQDRSAPSAPDDAARQRRALVWGDIVYLENAEKTIVCPNGRHLRIYGSPLSPRHGNWAFQYPRPKDVWKDKAPPGVDILITHGPPLAHLDLQLGCVHLLKELWRVRPRLHVFGHVHEGAGTERVQFDRVQAAYERTVLNGGGILNVSRVLVRLLLEYLRPTSRAQCILVNASMVGGLRDDERRHPVKVTL